MDRADLNKEQQSAVKHLDGPMLVVAGAGTGKTKVITQRIASLIREHKVSPERILAITFTDKAASEMEARVSELMDQYMLDVNITTFNAFGQNILKRFAHNMGMNAEMKLLKESQQVIFLRQNIDNLKLKYYAPVTQPETFLADLARYFSQLKSYLVLPEEYNKFVHLLTKTANTSAEKLAAAKQNELAFAYEQYQKLCRLGNIVDFDDQVYLSIKLLKENPDVLAKMQCEIEYIMVDEFQDTNRAQAELIDLIAAKKQNLVVVGDDDQCIYKFRGAAIENILEFQRRYPGAVQLSLRNNYRSSQQILDSSHLLIEHNNPDRLEAAYQIDKHLKAQFRGSEPKFHSFNTFEEEANWIAQDIAKKIKQGEEPQDIAILLRKNQQMRQLEKYLESAAVPFALVGQNFDLYRQPVVKTMLFFLRAVVDPKDNESLFHLLVSPVFGCDALALSSYASIARREHRTLAQVLADSDTEENVKAAIKQIDELRALIAELNVGRLAYAFLERTRYLKHLLTLAEDDPAVDQNIAQLNQFFTSLAEYERIAEDVTAVGYVQDLPALIGSGERLAVEELPDVYGQKIRVMSIHKAKGLEFKTVYIFDVTQGTFPSNNRKDGLVIPPELLHIDPATTSKEHLQEERRLMYVAMTRAKTNLILTASANHGGARAKKPSVFLSEALGSKVSMAIPQSSKNKTAQIELFSHVELPPKADLPWLAGDELVLSSGHIETYLMCPAEFKWRYWLRPPRPGNFSLDYGRLMHSCFQLYNQAKIEGGGVPLEALRDRVEQSWPREGFVSIEHSKRSLKQAISTIERFYKREEAANRHPKYVERSFELKMPELQAKLIGRFDAVYDDKTGVEIRDYKTGASNITDQKQADGRTTRSLQLGIYAYAWNRLYGIFPIAVSLDFVDVGLIGSVTKTDRQLTAVAKKIEQAATGIRALDFRPGSSHQYCEHIGFDL